MGLDTQTLKELGVAPFDFVHKDSSYSMTEEVADHRERDKREQSSTRRDERENRKESQPRCFKMRKEFERSNLHWSRCELA